MTELDDNGGEELERGGERAHNWGMVFYSASDIYICKINPRSEKLTSENKQIISVNTDT